MRKTAVLVGLVVGFVLSLTLSLAPSALASRNASGTYSLPSGNPVVSGTTISSTWANNTLSDVATELTSSVDRSGRGAMLAPLQLVANGGSVSAPALAFSGDTNSGLYRVAADDLAIAVGGVKAAEFSSAVCTLPLGLVVTQDTTNGVGISVTGNGTGDGILVAGGSTSGTGVTSTGGGTGHGVYATGAGTGYGVVGTGGGTSGTGVSGVGGAPNGTGATFFGTGTGAAITATGGSNGIVVTGAGGGSGIISTGNGAGQGIFATGGATDGTGVRGFGGATNGKGVVGSGAGTGAGGFFTAGTDATGGTRQTAVDCVNGDVEMDGVAYPTSTTSIKNRITPANITKAWALVTTNGSGSATVVAGLNIASCSVATNGCVGASENCLKCDFAQDFSSSNYVVVAGSNTPSGGIDMAAAEDLGVRAAGSVYLLAIRHSTGVHLDPAAEALTYQFIADGAQ